jgi:hypothetical protein
MTAVWGGIGRMIVSSPSSEIKKTEFTNFKES